jgi:hypothetical protein
VVEDDSKIGKGVRELSYLADLGISAGKVFVATKTQLVVYGGGLAFPLQTDTLTVTLNVIPPNNRSKFDLEVDGAQQLARAGNNATTGPLALASGAHVVSAIRSAGTSGSYVISYSGDCQASGAVTLQPGHPASCIVTARAPVCPLGQTWNPVANMCQKYPPCPAICKFGCYLPEITPTGPVWSCKANPGTVLPEIQP